MSAKAAFETERSTVITIGIASVILSLVLMAIPLIGTAAF